VGKEISIGRGLILSTAIALAGCAAPEVRPTPNPEKRSTDDYGYRLAMKTPSNNILLCYSDQNFPFSDLGYMSDFKVRIKKAYCPNVEANKELLGTEETYIEDLVYDGSWKPTQIIRQSDYTDRREAVPPPAFPEKPPPGPYVV
jgi:hypothetical protein